MNTLDMIIVGVAAAAVLLGAARGVARLVVVAGFIGLGWWLAVRYQVPVARRLLGTEEGLGLLAAFLVVFVPVLLAGGLAGRLAIRLLRAVELRWVDRLTGAAVGLALAVLLSAAVLLPLSAALPDEHPLLAGSVTARPLLRLTAWLLPLAPEEVRAAWERQRAGLGQALGSARRGAP